jgi:hypothetical protein
VDCSLIRGVNYSEDAQDLGQESLAMAALAQPVFRSTMSLTESQLDSRWEHPVANLAAFTSPRKHSFLFPSKGSAYRIIVTTDQSPPPAWIEPTISALIGVQALPEGWDSYGGKKISRDLISQSLSVLEMIMGTTSPAPSVVPLGDGGLQLEWHRKQQDLEIAFPAHDPPQYFYQNRATGGEQEGSASDITTLVQLLRKIV